MSGESVGVHPGKSGSISCPVGTLKSGASPPVCERPAVEVEQSGSSHGGTALILDRGGWQANSPSRPPPSSRPALRAAGSEEPEQATHLVLARLTVASRKHS